MTLQVVGAGLGRTGTNSLKIALERLLGGRCHHMLEVFGAPDEVPVWTAAARGAAVDWDALMAPYTASCDWPSAAFWPELSAAFPDALVVLSVRDPQAWLRSAQNTIFGPLRAALHEEPEPDQDANPWNAMIRALFSARFTTAIDDPAACIEHFEAHNARVRAEVDPARLLVWQASDGWEPLCVALGVPVPDEPFPRTNTSEQWLAHGDEIVDRLNDDTPPARPPD